MTYPNKIMILSDGNELEFKEVKVVNKVTLLNYVYVKSEMKLGMILPMPLEQLEKMILNNICKVI